MKTKFKITMLLLAIFCFSFASFGCIMLLYLFITDYNQMVNSYLSEKLYTKILIPFGLIVFFWSPFYLIKYFKTILIFPYCVEVNYLFPVFNQNFQLKGFDYYILVDEMTRNIPVEAIWFIKDKKVKLIIPGQLYSNYYEVKQEISKYKIENKGKIKLNPFQELKAKLGFTIDKI